MNVTQYFLAMMMLLSGLAPAMAAPAEDIRMFPDTLEGMTRHVIRLPAQEDEFGFRVELMAGKTRMMDCNGGSYIGEQSRATLNGWGYDYYVIHNIQPGPTTRKACPPDTEKEGLMPVMTGAGLLRYNSQLPLVAYVPEGFGLSYRIWRAGETLDASVE
jgi:ecotin